ncbi:MAG: hypothetical protein Q8777_02500 [Candidatus Phytoplasma stylosanthis]|uniref:hypothetical protein n=1 Tax=Candidatus Phytoplasma stylosanthis TaxID=2798314 RepID=UPI00293AD4B5|nr:hypothetical protein [Candidatus Phytoplasma stylosanthis]MDV3168198.1 hypothetical protein [Candidatus Phytoplasma stylosanthis]
MKSQKIFNISNKILLFILSILIGSTLWWFIFCGSPKKSDNPTISGFEQTETSSFVSMFFLEKRIKELEAEIKELEKSSYERFAQQQDWFEQMVTLIRRLMEKPNLFEDKIDNKPFNKYIPIEEKEN